MDHSATGWTPSAYLEEHIVSRPAPPPAPPALPTRAPAPPVANTAQANGVAIGSNTASTVRGKGAPPLPPTKRPVGKKPALPTPRDSGYAGGGGGGGVAGVPPQANARESGGSIAGGLAEALRQRQAAMQPRRDDSW